MEKKLYVGNLSYTSTEDDIKALFQDVGRVVDCQLMLDKFTSRSRGFAFVEMETCEEAGKAVERLNEKEFQGRNLRVNIARPIESRPPQRDDGGARRDDGGARRDYGGARGDRGDRRRGGGRHDGGHHRNRY